jgi:hypothetical protein
MHNPLACGGGNYQNTAHFAKAVPSLTTPGDTSIY